MGVLSADEELQREWQAFGRSELYEEPTEQELRDIGSSRHRSRGERSRRKRLKRNRQLLERMRNAEPPVPPYLLERNEVGESSSAPPPQAMDVDSDSADSEIGTTQEEQPCPPAQRLYALGQPMPFSLPWAEGIAAQRGESQAA